MAREHVLTNFNEIFNGLCKLSADVDVEVKKATHLLDILIKEVVTETDCFDVTDFIPQLSSKMDVPNPYVQQLIVSWITTLDSVPDIEMLDFLPDVLDGLFNMLKDEKMEIRQHADQALNEFLAEISENVSVEGTDEFEQRINSGAIINSLVKQSYSNNKLTRLTALTWIKTFIKLGEEKVIPYLPQVADAVIQCIADEGEETRREAHATNTILFQLIKSTNKSIDLPALLSVLTRFLHSTSELAKISTLQWICMLIDKIPQEVLELNSLFFDRLIRVLTDSSDKVVLLDIEILCRIGANTAQFCPTLHALLCLFARDSELLEKRGNVIIRKLCVALGAERVFLIMANILNKGLNDESKENPFSFFFISIMLHTLNVILMTSTELTDLRWLLRCAFVPDFDDIKPSPSADDNFSRQVVASYHHELCLRCKNHNCGVESNGIGFKCTCGADLDNDLHEHDSSCIQDHGKHVFRVLFGGWAGNPIAAVSLCLLAQAYELCSQLISRHFATMTITIAMLVELDKLIHLLESPMFLHVRLSLMSCHNEPNPLKRKQMLQQQQFLLNTLYGILMCIPQSDSFHVLNTRLQSVSALHSSMQSLSLTNAGLSTPPTKNDIEKETIVLKQDSELFAELVQLFEEVHLRQIRIGQDERSKKVLKAITVDR
eukprot:TRINITY_DN726706_c0_g1_i1.p1 TRINITY_DN726706_c0_g1~~TRINITY_DN726706_c0_g1_i1.p1  ORF type:complete len:744 (+),score=161.86 TRINITY_DN726706_c0_g1_i1:251-2233(+)